MRPESATRILTCGVSVERDFNCGVAERANFMASGYPQTVSYECRLRHTVFVMNRAYSVYLGRPTMVHPSLGSWEPSGPEPQGRQPAPMPDLSPLPLPLAGSLVVHTEEHHPSQVLFAQLQPATLHQFGT